MTNILAVHIFIHTVGIWRPPVAMLLTRFCQHVKLNIIIIQHKEKSDFLMATSCHSRGMVYAMILPLLVLEGSQ